MNIFNRTGYIMSIRLVILGILNQQPLHGYEIKQIIEEYMGDWTDIKFGSIYFALSKLAESGHIEVIEENRTGKRPAKTVYQITAAGKEEFLRLLKKAWCEHKQIIFPFDMALFFIKYLSKAEAVQYLQQRIENVTQKLNFLNDHKNEHRQNPYIPKEAIAIIDHSYYHLEAELHWLQDLLNNIDDYL